MPNVNAPNGFFPTMRNDSGGESKIMEFQKDPAYATAFFKYDLVTRLTNGYVSAAITPGTTPIQGVTLQAGPASTLTTHSIVISPDAVYEAQMSGDFQFADGGLNANAVLGSGDTLTKFSGHQVNSATLATTAGLDLRVDELVPAVGNEYGSFARVLVRINRHQRLAGSVGI